MTTTDRTGIDGSATNEAPPPTIPAVLDRAARRWPADEALVDGATRLTFAQLAAAADEAARALVASGVEPGDRVSIWAPNGHRWMVAALGIYRAGATLVPVNSRFKAGEAAGLLRATGAKILFTVTDFLATDYAAAIHAEPDLPALGEVVVLDGPASPATTQWADFVTRAATVPAEVTAARAAALTGDDVSDIIFTSGTTGKPKGAMLAHGPSTRLYTSWADVIGLGHGDRYLLVYPFFHTAGLKAGLLASLLVGATLVPYPVFDVPAVMRLVETEKITMLPGPPAVYQTILNSDLTGYDLSSWRLAVTGSAAVPVELVRRLRADLGLRTVVTGYGLTETTGTVAMCRHTDDPELVSRTSGRALDGIEVRVVDDAGTEVPRGEPGEIIVRGFNIMTGYLDNPAATAETIDADGWLKTGDIGVMDDGGNIAITDRKKDMFIVGGFNAYPAEIESMLAEHPAIAQVAVVGVPDERLGEVGMAYVIPRTGQPRPTPAEIIAWSRDRMANYKAPRYVEVVDALPLNATGKVVRYELRDRAAATLRQA
ncbi:FadD3 family acyl-CoA ligase [Pseudofrankia inefficax]|uniref:AMP-dependent synthetase and ligase n=1 Tax=Pseudofrankia inefficax (strain DSM 45817 / CECT 9037 / DDB 130130 / EuI1c) TaxID=298654 RepID=E3IZI3_PSEI1|nr:FadD3 family acyl-CoA ligase [Pseudofrankia inefficax]ADP82753.1 AMP-dependent synthetase and ligase [Pseudofrankia inefficax]